MSETLKPAMTPEEWEESSGKTSLIEWFAMTNRDQRKTAILQRFEQGNDHGVAAVALYGQPFGFTREDVKELRAFAAEPDLRGSTGPLLELADRIEALLPPDGKGM